MMSTMMISALVVAVPLALAATGIGGALLRLGRKGETPR